MANETRHPVHVMREANACNSLGRVRRDDSGQIAWVLVDNQCILLGWDGWYRSSPDTMAAPSPEEQSGWIKQLRTNPRLDEWDSNVGPSSGLTLEGHWAVTP